MSDEEKLDYSFFELKCVRLVEKDGKLAVETVMPWDIETNEYCSTYYS